MKQLKVPSSLLASLAVIGCIAVFVFDGPARGAADESESAKTGTAAKVEPYQLAAPLDVLMDVSDIMFYDMEDYLEEKRFRTLHKHSLFLAEMANVYNHMVGEDMWAKKEWKDATKSLREQFLKLAEVAKKQDASGFLVRWTKIEQTCDSCHETFRD